MPRMRATFIGQTVERQVSIPPATGRTAVPVNGNNNADVNNGGTITMSSTDTSAFTPWDIRLGEDQSGTNSTVDSGYFVQTGGSVTVSGWLRLGVEMPTSGMYTLSAGTLNCLLNVQDGELGSGTIGMSGGVLNQSVNGNALNIGGGNGGNGSGFFILSGGVVSCSQLDVGTTTGRWEFSISVPGHCRALAPAANGTLAECVTSGTTGYGNLVMSGGLLTTTNNYQIGAYGYGVLNQTGGTINSSSWTDLGRFAGGIGVANISGGQWNATGTGNRFFVGEGGRGILNLSGSGLVTCANGMTLGNSDGATTSSGIVDLSGGTISTTYVNMGGGTLSVFNFNGGAARRLPPARPS